MEQIEFVTGRAHGCAFVRRTWRNHYATAPCCIGCVPGTALALKGIEGEMVMNRAGLFVMLAAAFTFACSGDDVPASPTAPTPPPVASPPPTSPPPSTSCAPGTPSNLKVSVFTTQRTFTWNASTNAVDYFIQIGTASGTSDLIYTNTTQTTYSWNGYSPGTYYARVHARNSCGSSNPSNEIVFN
jgi:hypothetical protein